MYNINEQQLADLFYDKLCNNDNNEMFEPSMVDNMAVVYDEKDRQYKIALTIGDVEFVWTLEKHDKGDFTVFENETAINNIGE